MSNGTPYFRRRSLFGPLLLVIIGVLLLLFNIGVIPIWWLWFSRYWPVILILLGVSRLVEQLWARQKGYPAPIIGGGGIFLLILLFSFGMVASATRNVDWSGWSNDVNIDNDDFFRWFGSRYEFNSDFTQTIEPGKTVKIVVSRGDLTVSPSNDDQTRVVIHKVLSGDSESEAKTRNDETNPRFQQQ